ncbi:MAG: radical SAM protein [Bdellovibrionaceae bacterium]|nr:radical SAM protein [Bdellovibrionales bacterium]MCB9085935.1 radical SAM protein [Pseudobdellovibrionaceae bacterium]
MAVDRSDPGWPGAFCLFPWVEQSFDIHGNLHLCNRSTTIYGDKGEQITVERPGDLLNIWNGSAMKKVRLQMLAGTLPKACGRCIDMEDDGRESKRLGYLRHYPSWAPSIEKLLAATADDGHVEILPVSHELRASNLCNAKCVTCSPEFSSALVKDHQALKECSPEAYSLVRRTYQAAESPMYNWAQNAGVYQYLKENLSQVRLLYFSGGEPLMIPANTELVEACIASGDAEHLTLVYDSNVLLVDDHWLGRWEHFEKVEVRISLDGIGERFDYIRYPGPFSKFERAVDLLANWQNSRARVTLQTTASLLNVLDLTDIITWYRNKFRSNAQLERRFFFKSVRDPAVLSLFNVPESMMVTAIDRLESLLEEIWAEMPKNSMTDSIEALVRMLKYYQKNHHRNPSSLKEAVVFLEGLDRIHKTNWKATFPEFAGSIL